MYIHTCIVCLSVCSEDGQLSERECINRVSCRYGDTEQVSQYICASILSGKASVPITSFNRDPFSEWTSSLLSLAVTATSIIFVATNTRLSRPNYVWSFVGTNTCCFDRQTYFCRDKRGVLSPQRHICRDKTSLCGDKSMLAATKRLSRQNCVWYFVATKIRLSFVATKRYLWQLSRIILCFPAVLLWWGDRLSAGLLCFCRWHWSSWLTKMPGAVTSAVKLCRSKDSPIQTGSIITTLRC